MSKWHGGKGSRARPLSVDRETYEGNWDRIFGKKDRRERALDQLTQLSQEMGLYEHDSNRVEHENCGTPQCCGTCYTATKDNNNA